MSQPAKGQDRLDYLETADITEVHAAIAREHAEPSADVTPIPTWLSIVCAVALCWAGAYIGVFHGGFSPTIFNEYDSNPTAFFPLPGKSAVETGGPAAELTQVALGEKVYKEVCQACHQPTGLGMAGQFPPLAGSEWVDGSEANEKRLVAIALKGLKGPITVKGGSYNNQMPAQEPLGPKKIAAVLTYIRQAWGNKGGETSEAQVAAGKKEFASRTDQWTADELKQIPLDAKLEGAAAPAASATAEAKAGDASKPGVAPAAPSTGTYDLAASIQRGATHYATSCGVCHMPTGVGLPPVNPPLVGSELALGDARRVIAIPLKGINGPLKVGSTVYPGPMLPPALMFPAVINDDKNLADVLNYIRNSWGNKAEVITPEQVGKVRAEFAGRPAPWTEAELLNFPPAK